MEALRQFLKGWLGKILLVVFLAPLALLGIESYFSSSSNPDVVATVGKVNIASRELDNTVIQERARIANQLGGNAALIDDDKVKVQVLDSLIDRSLLEQQAEKLGLNMTDGQISAMIQQDPTFQDEKGVFSQKLFDAFLKQRGMNKQRLFSEARSTTALGQLARGIGQSAFFPQQQLDRLIKLQTEQRNVSIHRIPAANYTNQVNVTDTEVSAYYEKHKAELNTKKTIDLDYVVLARDSLAVAAVTADELKKAYDARVQVLTKDSQRKASHILFTGDNAKQQALNVLTEIKAGKDFAAMAKQYSQDSASKDKGGDLGFLSKGQQDPEFEKALYALQEGQVSEVVESQYGAHIIRLTEVKSAPAPTLDELKESLIQEVQLSKKEDAYQEAVQRINDEAVDGKSVKDIATDESLKAETVKDFTDSAITPATLAGKVELMHPDVVKKAFDEFAINDQSTSVGIDVEPGKTIWIQSTNYRPVRTQTLAEATKEVKARLVNEAAMKLAEAEAKKIVSQINTTHDLAAASKNLKVEFQSLGDISRQVPILERTEMATAFSVTLDGENVVAKSDKTEEGFSVLAVKKAVKPADISIPDEQKKQIAEQFRSVQGQQQFNDYIEYVKSQFEVQKNDAVLTGKADGAS